MVYGVFELPLPRNAQKRTQKKSQEKKVGGVGGWVWDLVKARGLSVELFFGGPSVDRISSSTAFCPLDFKPTEKHEKNVVVRKRASKRQPGITLGCCGGILAIHVQYNEVCAYTQPASTMGYVLACACFGEGFV
jgi:hypothetical protein